MKEKKIVALSFIYNFFILDRIEELNDFHEFSFLFLSILKYKLINP